MFAHYIGDTAIQTDFQAQNKGKYWYIMLCHCMVWTGCVSIALQYSGTFQYYDVPFLILGHALMDSWKSRQPRTPEQWWKIYPDQAFHLLQCTIAYFV